MASEHNDPLMEVSGIIPNIEGIVSDQAVAAAKTASAELVGVCQQLLNGLNGDISGFVSSCISECRGSLQSCQNCVLAQVGMTIDSLNALLAKCQAGIANSIQNQFLNVVDHVIAAGVPLPSAGAVQAIGQGVQPVLAVAQNPVETVPAGGSQTTTTQPPSTGVCLPGYHYDTVTEQCLPDNPGTPIPPGGGTTGGGGGTINPPVQGTGNGTIDQNGHLVCPVGETPYTDSTGATYCVADTFVPRPPPTLPGTGGGGGPPTLPGGGGGGQGGTGGTYNPPSIPGQPPRTCQGLTDPCANLPPGWTSQSTDHGVQFYVKVPVFDSCGNMVACWQMPVGCKLNLPAVRYDANGCPIVTQVICDNPAKCVPPWVCTDGYSYDQKTGTCTADQPDTPPMQPCDDGSEPAADGTCPPPPPVPTPPPPPQPLPESGALDYCTPSKLAQVFSDLSTSIVFSGQNWDGSNPLKEDCDQYGRLNPVKYLCSAWNWVTDKIASAVKNAQPNSSCVNAPWINNFVFSIPIRIFGGWFGAIPDSLIKYLWYRQNLACQYIVPSASAVTDLSVRGFITDDEYRGGVAVNGNCIPWQDKIKDASYRYPTINESVSLYLRNEFTVDEFHDSLRRNGVKNDTYADYFLKLSRWFPDTARAAAWTQQGVSDQHYADVFGLDNGFLEWQQSPEYTAVGASNQSDDDARKIYRSTWLRPTLGQVIEAYQRIGTDQVLSDTGINVPAVTADELTTALTNSGIPPTWQSRIAYLQYSPISIRHLKLLYETGVEDEEELAARYRQLRYAPDDASKLAHAIAVTTDQAKAKLNGFFTSPEILRLYQRDGMTRDEAQSYLQMSGVPADSVDSLLTQAEVKRASTDQAATVQALKKRFMYGDYDPGQSQQQLIQLGIDAERVSVVVKNWQTELDLKHKQPAVNTLCDWVQRGYLTGGDYIRRMQNLGFDVGDASVYLQTCQAKQQEKNVKEAIKQAKALEAAARKAAADAKKASPYKDPPKVYRTPVKTERKSSVTRRNLTKNKTTVTDTTADKSVVGAETTVQESITEQTI